MSSSSESRNSEAQQNVTLQRCVDYTYLGRLIWDYREKQEDLDSLRLMKKRIKNLFYVKNNGKTVGVICISCLAGCYYLDAYKDKTVRSPIKVSLDALNLALDYARNFTDEIHIALLSNNRRAIALVERVGFTHIVDTVVAGLKHSLYIKEL